MTELSVPVAWAAGTGASLLGSRRTSGECCLVLSAACYEDALTEAVEGWEAVGPSLDHLDLVDHSFGVAVGDRLVEVGEQFFAPEPDAFGEGAEGRDRCSVDGGEEAREPLLGLDAAGRAVDRAEGFLESPRFGEQRLCFEEFAE
jgi:hypothetical protein